MTHPRPVLQDRTYMITRRCASRRFFLRPDDKVDQAFAYCFGVAAKRYGLDVYWLSVMSNHHHDGVHDNEGKYPKFFRYFHSLLARCLNVHLSRWENFWATEQSGVLLLGDGDAIFDKMIYSLTNPVKDHLVDRVLNWPGLNSLRYQLADGPMVVKRPDWFFDGWPRFAPLWPCRALRATLPDGLLWGGGAGALQSTFPAPAAQAPNAPTWYALRVSRISDEELAKGLAENLDADGHDVGLDAWVSSWTPEQRARAEENVRRSIEAARRQLKVDQGGHTDL